MTAIEHSTDDPFAQWMNAPAPWSQYLNGAGAALASACAVGLRAVAGSRSAGRFGILMYHRCSPRVPGIPHPTINVTPRRMRRQLEGLLRRGHQFWPLQRVLEASAEGAVIPPQVVVLTFDDGYENVYLHAARILRDLQIPATIFINTAYLDSDAPFPFDHWGRAYYDKAPEASYRPLTVAQCQELVDDPLFEIGAHTHSHEDFRDRPADLYRDLEMNVRVLNERFGVERPSFAFPYGTPHLGFTSSSLVAAARSTGVRCGLTTESALVDPKSDPFSWGRLHVFGWDTAQSIDARLSGWYSWAPRQRQHVMRLLPWRTAGQPAIQSAPRSEPPVTAATRAAHRSAVPPSSANAPAETRPLVSIVMPTFNRAGWVGEALQSLTEQVTDGQFDYEIVVVDNASSDDTAGVIEAFRASALRPVHYVLETKPGDAPARNAGIRHARGQWIAFFDDDQFADPRWLLELYRAAVRTGSLVVGGPVLLDLSPEKLEWLGPHCRRALREIRLSESLAPYGQKQLPGTGNALVARTLFDQIGLFNEEMRTGGSDSDFFKRARQSGKELWYAPEAVIRHRVPSERLTKEYLRWDALSGGAGHAAHFDHREKGTLTLCVLCMARVAQALLVNAPLYFAARLSGRDGHALGRQTLLWRTEGYVRKTLAVLGPRLFAQPEFFASLEFRHGRTVSASADTSSLGSVAVPIMSNAGGIAE